MRNATSGEKSTNVFKLNVKKSEKLEEVNNDLLFPASKNYSVEEQEDYIFHHQKKWDYKISHKDDPRVIADKIISQLDRIKVDSERIEYYLSELNLD